VLKVAVEAGAAVEEGDACAAAGEFEREREADDSSTGDTDVGVLHVSSLEELPGTGRAVALCSALRGRAAYIVTAHSFGPGHVC